MVHVHFLGYSWIIRFQEFADYKKKQSVKCQPWKSDADPIILTKLFTHCVSHRLLLGDSSSFYVWWTNNNSIARKVVSKTVINCGCAFWYIYIEANRIPGNIFWSKLQTRKLLVCGLTYIWGVGPCELWSCEYLQISNIYYVVPVHCFCLLGHS